MGISAVAEQIFTGRNAAIKITHGAICGFSPRIAKFGTSQETTNPLRRAILRRSVHVLGFLTHKTSKNP